jgi:hypothetical protein
MVDLLVDPVDAVQQAVPTVVSELGAYLGIVTVVFPTSLTPTVEPIFIPFGAMELIGRFDLGTPGAPLLRRHLTCPP